MILLLDNYDSFTYNLAQYLGELGADLEVYRNDAITVEEVLKKQPEGVVISPGPGRPAEAGISIPLVRALAGKVPILGVCLGHQAIGAAFGGKVVRAERLMHGKSSPIFHDERHLYQGLPSPFSAVRYHSLLLAPETLPPELEICAESDTGEIMGLRHSKYNLEGVQFHPESILTEHGKQLLANWLDLVKQGGVRSEAHQAADRSLVQRALAQVLAGESLSAFEAGKLMEAIMEGEVTPAQLAGLLIALRLKGETPAEIAAFARVMREKAVKVPVHREVLDTCGTGGDRLKTFNVSTAAAFVVAGAGYAVAKHGNRSVTSSSGSADVLEALGVRLDLTPEQVGRCVDEVGLGFLFAPALHPAMKYAVGPRRELAQRTVFNVLGPLVNPAGARRQLVGVFDASLCQTLAEALRQLGSTRALVVHGEGGLDEVSTFSRTFVAELSGGRITTYTLAPEDFGLKRGRFEDVTGGSPEENARLIEDLLAGEKGPRTDLVLANAAAALLTTGEFASVGEAMEAARESLESGKALRVLEHLRTLSNQLAEGGEAG